MGSIGARRASGNIPPEENPDEILRIRVRLDGFERPIVFVKYPKSTGGDDKFYMESITIRGMPDVDSRGLTRSEFDARIKELGKTVAEVSMLSRADIEREREERRAGRFTSEALDADTRRLARSAKRTSRASRRGRPVGSR